MAKTFVKISKNVSKGNFDKRPDLIKYCHFIVEYEFVPKRVKNRFFEFRRLERSRTLIGK